MQNKVVFDGNKLALEREESLKIRVSALKDQGKQIKIAAILFKEDLGSVIYSNLKQEAAQRVGVGYELYTFSMKDPKEVIQDKISHLNMDGTITGIIIQKPWRKTWINSLENKTKEDFSKWWRGLVQSIDINKDVDGLHPQTLADIEAGTWQDKGRVLPATCKAVLTTLAEVGYVFLLNNRAKKGSKNPNIIEHPKVVILGTSDLLGKPLYYLLKNRHFKVENIGTKGLNERIADKTYLKDTDVIVSATGRKHLISGEMVNEGVVVIDVGEPQPDVEFGSVVEKASFITPVPGGVGPMTVVSLLENGVELVE